MKINDLTWRVGGEAGFGILSAGTLLAKAAVRSGLYAFANSEYPSLIRGGHNFLHVRINEKPISSQRKYVNMLVALNDETIKLHQHLVTGDGCIIYDSNTTKNADFVRKDVRLYPIPMVDIIRNVQGNDISRNIVSLGASFAILGFELAVLEDAIKDQFGSKAGKVVEINLKAAVEGYNYVKNNRGVADRENFPNGKSDFKDLEPFQYRLERRKPNGRILISGNEAIGIGAIKAGLKFFAAYPMTPASSILDFMCKHDAEFNIVVKQTEDEIAAINMAVGASFAGARSMTATSGGGFDLMAEGLSFAGMVETPLVAVEVQRPGPSTGMPTRTDQSDLLYVLHTGHGEFERVVIAPGDVTEAFNVAFDAFNIADRFQLPVIIISDKYLADCLATADPFKTEGFRVERGKMASDSELAGLSGHRDFRRSSFGLPDGVSPRSIPGQKNGIHRMASDEHDEWGDVTEHEPAEDRTKAVDRRFRKLENGVNSLLGPAGQSELHTPFVNVIANHSSNVEDADVSLVSWGSTKGIILEAMKLLAEQGVKANFLQVIYLHPFPDALVSDYLKKSRLTINIETNKTSQMASLIREKTGVLITQRINRYDGRPFEPDDLAEQISAMVKNGDGKSPKKSNGKSKTKNAQQASEAPSPMSEIDSI